jgi:hypothetical protein
MLLAKKRVENSTDGCNFNLLQLLAIYEVPSFFSRQSNPITIRSKVLVLLYFDVWSKSVKLICCTLKKRQVAIASEYEKIQKYDPKIQCDHQLRDGRSFSFITQLHFMVLTHPFPSCHPSFHPWPRSWGRSSFLPFRQRLA